MEAKLDSNNGEIAISFEENELVYGAFLMEEIIEEQWRKGALVPDLDAAFFQDIVGSEGEKGIVFDHHYFELVLTLLEEIAGEADNYGIDVSKLGEAKHKIKEWLYGAEEVALSSTTLQ